MKRIISHLLFISALVLSSAACEKAEVCSLDADENLSTKSLVGSSVTSTGKHLVKITDTVYYNTSDVFKSHLCDALEGAVGDDLFSTAYDVLFTDNIIELMARMYAHSANGATGRIEEYHFLYNSTAVDGSPIVLSGMVTLPNYCSSPYFSHYIDNMTIYHDYWKNLGRSATELGNIEQIRALFNQLVVMSDFEGYGYTAEGHIHPFFCYNEFAQQSIDCALAALELIDRLGVKMREGYKTYNMGMSKGAPIAMAASKIISNSDDPVIKKAFNVGGTYCCSGPYGLSDILESGLGQENVEMCWVAAAMIQSVYVSHPDLFEGYQLYDFFAPGFLEIKSNFKGQDMTLMDILNTRQVFTEQISSYYIEHGLTSLNKILNPAFITKDNKFESENPQVEKLIEDLDDETPTAGWTPDAPLLIEHSYADEFVPHEITMDNYTSLKLKNGVPNLYVEQMTYPELEHQLMSTVGLLRMAVLEYPSLPIEFNIAF